MGHRYIYQIIKCFALGSLAIIVLLLTTTSTYRRLFSSFLVIWLTYRILLALKIVLGFVVTYNACRVSKSWSVITLSDYLPKDPFNFIRSRPRFNEYGLQNLWYINAYFKFALLYTQITVYNLVYLGLKFSFSVEKVRTGDCTLLQFTLRALYSLTFLIAALLLEVPALLLKLTIYLIKTLAHSNVSLFDIILGDLSFLYNTINVKKFVFHGQLLVFNGSKPNEFYSLKAYLGRCYSNANILSKYQVKRYNHLQKSWEKRNKLLDDYKSFYSHELTPFSGGSVGIPVDDNNILSSTNCPHPILNEMSPVFTRVENSNIALSLGGSKIFFETSLGLRQEVPHMKINGSPISKFPYNLTTKISATYYINFVQAQRWRIQPTYDYYSQYQPQMMYFNPQIIPHIEKMIFITLHHNKKDLIQVWDANQKYLVDYNRGELLTNLYTDTGLNVTWESIEVDLRYLNHVADLNKGLSTELSQTLLNFQYENLELLKSPALVKEWGDFNKIKHYTAEDGLNYFNGLDS